MKDKVYKLAHYRCRVISNADKLYRGTVGVARGCSGDLHYDRPRNLPSNPRMTDEMKLRKRATVGGAFGPSVISVFL